METQLPNLEHAKQYVANKQVTWRQQGVAPSAYVQNRKREGLAQEFRSDVAWLRQHVCPWLDTPAHKAELHGAVAGVEAVLDPEWAAAAGIVVEAFELVCRRPRTAWGWLAAGGVIAGGLFTIFYPLFGNRRGHRR